jgi:hypothetical protein
MKLSTTQNGKKTIQGDEMAPSKTWADQISGFEILPTGVIQQLGVVAAPMMASDLELGRVQAVPGTGDRAEEESLLGLLYLTLPKGWHPEFGAVINGRSWFTGPREASLWHSNLEIMAMLSEPCRQSEGRLLFGDTYDLERQERTGQRQGMVPAFFADLLEGPGAANIRKVFPNARFLCGYSLDLSLLGTQYEGQRVQLYEAIELSEMPEQKGHVCAEEAPN